MLVEQDVRRERVAHAHEVERRVEAILDLLQEQDAETDREGRLSDEAAAAIRGTGIVRGLQPREFGGFELRLSDVFRGVLAIGARSGAAGWVTAVVASHAWEASQGDVRLQEELWGTDPDTWISSSYMPGGAATVVDGGYRFSGDWAFSSGSDHSRWVLLGGSVIGADGSPDRADPRHYYLPRADYELVDGSWDTVGLRGTGSKNVAVRDVFVPEHRTIRREALFEGGSVRDRGLDRPLYFVPRDLVLAGSVAAATIAMAQGVIDAYVDLTRRRRLWGSGPLASADPHQLAALGQAAADVKASTRSLLANLDDVAEELEAGRAIPDEKVLEIRRDQVRDVHRAVAAADLLFLHSGGSATRKDSRIQRAWRDLHTGANHAANMTEPQYSNHGLAVFGHPLPPGAARTSP